MAAKRQPHDLIHQTTNASSESESEDHEHSRSRIEDSSDSEPQELTQTKPQETLTQKSSSEDSDSSVPLTTHKTPIKPKNSNKKRPAPEKVVSKKSKKASLFTRVFSEQDEIVLLQGIIDFKSNNDGAEPTSNLVTFHDSVKEMLSCTVTKRQISDKIKSLKKTFNKNLEKKNSKNLVLLFTEYKLFELSKKVWASDGHGTDSSKKDANVVCKTHVGKKEINRQEQVRNQSDGHGTDSKKNANVVSNTEVGKKEINQVKNQMEVDIQDFSSLYPCLCASLESEAVKYCRTPMDSQQHIKEVFSKLKRDRATELEDEWKGFCVMDLQLYAKRVEMISKQAEAVMDVIQP